MKIGDTLAGRYELSTRIGGGGLGEVFRGLDTRTRREVAIKIYDATRCPMPALMQYQAQIAATMGISHPGVVLPRIQIAVLMKPPFVVGEALDGRDLGALIGDGAVPVPRAIDIVIACADALTALDSETDTPHRAIKPGNVWIGGDGQVRLLDFAVAELGVQPAPPRADGTAAEYRAPEQIEGAPGDARSDVFSLGVLLFELTTGVHPFTGASPAEAATEALAPSPPRPSSVGASVSLPPALEALLLRMLARDPDDRPAGAAALGRELLAVKRLVEPAPTAPAPTKSPRPAATHTDDPTTALSLPVMRRPRAATPVAPAPVPGPAPAPVATHSPDEPPMMAVAPTTPTPTKQPVPDSWLAGPSSPAATRTPTPDPRPRPAERRPQRNFVPDEPTEAAPRIQRRAHTMDEPTEALPVQPRRPPVPDPRIEAPALQRRSHVPDERTEELAPAAPRQPQAPGTARPRPGTSRSLPESDELTEVLLKPSRHDPGPAVRRPPPASDEATQVLSALHKLPPGQSQQAKPAIDPGASSPPAVPSAMSPALVIGGVLILTLIGGLVCLAVFS